MAAYGNSLAVTFFALLLGSAVIDTCQGGPIATRKFHVQFENAIRYLPLNVHCKSKDDDLGERVLQPGEKFDWGFHENYMGTTLFFCSAWWKGGRKSFEVFEGKEKVVYDYCGGKTCRWSASEFGIHQYHSKTGQWVFKYPWEKL